ncbi:MAG: PIN domain-containing protein, partial [Lachnospiraceae bacterium]|nr:PIN domain-containing protein [Lachnospiraceae bacterium]
MIYAVIDTNVLVSALLSKNSDAATVQVFNAIADCLITPLYHQDILKEYSEVLHRDRFRFDDRKIKAVLDAIVRHGIEVVPKPTGDILVDMD